jgi:hypothetical protein
MPEAMLFALAMVGCAPHSRVAVPGICWGRVLSTGRLKG